VIIIEQRHVAAQYLFQQDEYIPRHLLLSFVNTSKSLSEFHQMPSTKGFGGEYFTSHIQSHLVKRVAFVLRVYVDVYDGTMQPGPFVPACIAGDIHLLPK
jgi:hypothetical protein